jgi:hypothetical protein
MIIKNRFVAKDFDLKKCNPKNPKRNNDKGTA